MNWHMIRTLMLKDIKLYFSNRFFALITVLGLLAYIGIYFLMPLTVDETIEMGLYIPEIPTALTELLADEGVVFLRAESEEALKVAVLADDISAGYAFPNDLAQRVAAGEKIPVNVYFASNIPQEFKEIYIVVLDEFVYAITGQTLDIDVTEEVLGPDMSGEQIPPRKRMVPLLTVVVLMMETMGLANLISTEIETGTLQALMITPLSVEGLFVSKGLFGTIFAFLQAALLIAVTGGLGRHPLLILLALLFGAAMVTGVGFLMASVGKDMLSVLAWGVLAILVLVIPSMVLMFPGGTTGWIKAIPSYYLVNTINQVVNFGASWADVGINLIALLAFAIGFMALGVVVLRRKLR